MHILLANDDGIQAYGLRVLAQKLSAKGHKLIVVAPNGERSAYGHAITMRRPLELNKIDFDCNATAYSLDGTPADCVKFAIQHLLDSPPDLVLSGINHGANLGSDVMYSGTVSAATEGRYLGVKSIAISCYNYRCGNDLVFAADYIADKLEVLAAVEMSPSSILNVNHPPYLAKGEIVTIAGVQEYNDAYFVDENNPNLFHLKGHSIKHYKNAADCDVEWAFKGYVTITPITYDMTNYTLLESVKQRLKQS